MPELDAFSRDYLRLLLEIHAHHIDGYVDAYYGPPELKAEVEAAAPQKPAELLAIITDLRGRIPAGDPARAASGSGPARRRLHHAHASTARRSTIWMRSTASTTCGRS